MDGTSKDEQSSNSFPRGLFLGVFVITALVMVFFWWLYLDHVGTEISDKGKNWSEFGSYFGGVLGPLFSAASILFVWWQGHKTMTSQQQQLDKLNQQLGLEKQIIFRSEFVRLLTRAIEQGEKEIQVGYVGLVNQNTLKTNITKQSYKKVSRNIQQEIKDKAKFISEKNLELAWELLCPYLANIFEIADHLNRSDKFDVSAAELEPYLRQFKIEFYTEIREMPSNSQLLLIDELLKKPEIHGYHGISGIFQKPESSS